MLSRLRSDDCSGLTGTVCPCGKEGEARGHMPPWAAPLLFHFLNICIYSFTDLAALGLSCGMGDLLRGMRDLVP